MTERNVRVNGAPRDRPAPMAQASEARPTIALSSGSLYTYGLNRFFELAHEAGAEAAEVIVDHRWDTRQSAYLQRLSETFHLRVVSLHAPFHAVPLLAPDYLGGIAATVRLAEEIGARVVVAHPEWYRERRLAARVRAGVRALQASTSVVVTVENMPYKPARRRARYPTYTVEAIRRFEQITLDTAHLGTAGIDILPAYRTLAPNVRHVHLSDFANGEEHLVPGDGVLPLGSFLETLVRDGYSGIITIELNPNCIGEGDEVAVVNNLRRALSFCRQHIAPKALVPS